MKSSIESAMQKGLSRRSLIQKFAALFYQTTQKCKSDGSFKNGIYYKIGQADTGYGDNPSGRAEMSRLTLHALGAGIDAIVDLRRNASRKKALLGILSGNLTAEKKLNAIKLVNGFIKEPARYDMFVRNISAVNGKSDLFFLLLSQIVKYNQPLLGKFNGIEYSMGCGLNTLAIRTSMEQAKIIGNYNNVVDAAFLGSVLNVMYGGLITRLIVYDVRGVNSCGDHVADVSGALQSKILKYAKNVSFQLDITSVLLNSGIRLRK